MFDLTLLVIMRIKENRIINLLSIDNNNKKNFSLNSQLFIAINNIKFLK